MKRALDPAAHKPRGLILRGGRILDPRHGVDMTGDVYIDVEGLIAAVVPTAGKAPARAPAGFGDATVVSIRGRVVCPGLVDIRARLREPGQEHKATLESELRAAVAGGITTLACPPDTMPPIDTPAMAQMIQSRAFRIGLAFVHPIGALTRNLEGKRLADLAALNEAGCLGFSNGLAPLTDTLVMRRFMEYAASFDYTVYLHAEDPWLAADGCAHEGEIATRLGLPGIPEAAETVAVARELALIEHTGVRAHFCGLSSARALNMIAQARAQGLRVSADVTAHHLHLTEHDLGHFNTQCHVRPPLRTQRDRDALRVALREGTIMAICSDHQPHEPDAKLAPFESSEPGVSGLETLLPLTLRLVEEDVLTLPEAIALLTHHPAGVLGLDAGHLGVGAQGDLCVFDPDAEWTVDRDTLVSRGRNSPFLGWRLRGRVTQTLVRGKLVFPATA